MQGLFPQACEASGVIALWERIAGEVCDRGVCERVVRDVHVKWLLIGHRPDDAKFVFEVVPKLAIASVLFDATFETVGAVCTNITDIYMKSFQNFFAWFGELLDGVKSFYFFFDTKVGEQIGVGPFMYSGLEAAEVDGHSVGDFMLESH